MNNTPLTTDTSHAAGSRVVHAYLHVPFCLRKCSYCAFVSERIGSGERVKPYVEALKNQIRLQSFLADRETAPLKTLYLGGGTPTCLPSDDLAGILQLVADLYGLDQNAEVTIEMNPGTLDRQDLKRLREAGFNRLSIGVQSLNNDLLSRLGRSHSVDDVWATFDMAREAGFSNMNADLMLGLPGQTVPDILEAVRAVVKAGATHLSFYSLILEEGTPLAGRVAAGLIDLPDEDDERDQYHAAFELLEELGLPPYEISCAARPGFHSHHNVSYWEGRSYYGWGTSASSYIDRVRRTMTSSTDEYLEIFADGVQNGDPWAGTAEEERIDDEEAMREYLIFGLRRMQGVSDAEALQLLGRGIPDDLRTILDEHTKHGLLRSEDSSSWSYTAKGLDLADTVARDLI